MSEESKRLPMDAKRKKEIIEDEFVNPDEPYELDPDLYLGFAFIVNNLASEMTETVKDVNGLKKVYTDIGFKVKEWTCYTKEKMDELKLEMKRQKYHISSNCFMLTVLAHGDEKGWLSAAKEKTAECFTPCWQIDDIVETLDSVPELVGKPKLIVVDACRGDKLTEGQTDATRSNEGVEKDVLNFVANKADFYIAYATVSGYVSAGSYFAKSLAKNLKKYHETHSIDRIFTCVKHEMAKISMKVRDPKTKDVKDNAKICPEDRSSLRKIFMFHEPRDDAPDVPDSGDQSTVGAGAHRAVDTQVPAESHGVQPQGNTQSTETPATDSCENPVYHPPANPKELSDAHVLSVAQDIPGEGEYYRLASALKYENAKRNLTNYPKDITTATYNMLNEWRHSVGTGREQWEVLHKALSDAKLKKLQQNLMT